MMFMVSVLLCKFYPTLVRYIYYLTVYPVLFILAHFYGVLVFIAFFEIKCMFIFICHSGDFFLTISLYEGRSLTPTGA